MNIRRITPLIIIFTFLVSSLFVLSVQTGYSIFKSTNNTIASKWSCNLLSSGTTCGENSNDQFGHVPSPAIADINGDGVDDIVVATSKGRVIALKSNGFSGEKLWNVDIAPAFGMSAGTQVIESSPAVADIDGDGRAEVVVGSGKSDNAFCRKGGVIVLEHDGSVKSGWPKFATDEDIAPSNCPDPIYSSPALGDLDNDGDLEIIAAGFDKRIYVWHHNGQLLDGFPIDSHLSNRFPTWADLRGHLSDTIWSSPTLADLDNDGFLDIIIGADEGNFDASFGGNANGWACPYSTPWGYGYCGGSLYAINRFGDVLPNFPIYTLEHIQSTPALYDINTDGNIDILIGTGTFYHANSVDHPTYGYRLFGWDNQGDILPGWGTQGANVGERGGVVTGGAMPASPAIGDIDGDGDPEIVAISMDKQVYAYHHTGSPVSGFPKAPVDQTGNSYAYNVGRGVTLADMNGDGAMEIFVTTGWSVTILNGSGNQLTTTSNPPNAPFYYARGSLSNMPAFGDVDGDGELEMVVQNSNLYVWDLPGAGEADWPMFKNNAARTSSFGQPIVDATPATFSKFHLASNPSDAEFELSVKNMGIGCFDWQATPTYPGDVSLSSTSGTICEGEETAVSVTISTSGLVLGGNDLGQINITGSIDNQTVANSPQSIPLVIYKVNEIYSIYLPAIQK